LRSVSNLHSAYNVVILKVPKGSFFYILRWNLEDYMWSLS
jgi:hypothetical protein